MLKSVTCTNHYQWLSLVYFTYEVEMNRYLVPAVVSAIALLVGGDKATAASIRHITNTGQAGLSDQARERARDLQRTQPAPDTSSAVAMPRTVDLTPGTAASSASARGSSGPAGNSTRAYGSFGIPYTSTRVVHNSTKVKPNSPAFLSSTFPYRAVGRLTFSDGTGSYICSASLIRRSVIVTAAHCVQEFGSGASFYSNWQFTPGYYNAGTKAVQPYGVWNWGQAVVAASWSSGSDTGTGDARDNDLAVIVLQKDRKGEFIGDLTGYLGYGWNNPSFVSSSKTGNLAVAEVSTLGYPCLLDACKIMQRTDGPTYLTQVGPALQYWQGSNFTGGSSGGPWVVNFKSQDPVFYNGAGAGVDPGLAVIGVTSWGSADPNVSKDNYSSRFGQNAEFPNSAYGNYGAGNIGALLSYACSLNPPNNASTYEQLGYCN